jgi:hypothetical protein
MTMVGVRRWHAYIGLFIGPSVLFFALTGALQLFSLHEAHGTYQPPAIIEKLSSVHKDQVFAFGDHHEAHPAQDAAPPAATTDDDDKTAISTYLLKGFFLLVALGLALSTGFGLWMGLTQARLGSIGWLLVICGGLIPVCLLLF